MKTSLTGITPNNTAHLGTYLGAIRPALELAKTYRSLYFIADYHALTKLHDPAALNRHVYDVTAAWIASGLDPKRTLIYRQSSVIEVFELTWVLECLIATGQLERGHSYKDAVARGESPNAGVFNYPVLMAADIILYDTDVVPVGSDQRQHLEIARDVATRLNFVFGEGTVVVPDALITDAPLVPGTDGRKMSKSYGNTVALFAPAKELRSVVMKFKTGSEPLEAPKDPETSVPFQLYKLVASPADIETIRKKLVEGGFGWGHLKEALYDALDAELAPKRAVYDELRADEARLDAILEEGAERARAIARATMARVRAATGIATPR